MAMDGLFQCFDRFSGNALQHTNLGQLVADAAAGAPLEYRECSCQWF